MKPLLILPIALLLTFTSCANAPKAPLSERELIQQVFGNLVDTNRTIMDGYDEYHALADSLLYHMETVKERKMRIGARCIAQEIIGSMTNESEYISAEEVAFFVDTLLQHYSLIQDYWHVDTINDGYWFSCENVILHQEKTKITELNVHIMEEGIFVLIDFPWDAASNPVITFFDEEYKPVEDVRFDAKTEDVSVTNRSEDKTLSMFLHQDCFDAMLKYPYMWIEYVSDDSALEKDPPIVQQLIPLWHLFNTTMQLFVQK